MKKYINFVFVCLFSLAGMLSAQNTNVSSTDKAGVETQDEWQALACNLHINVITTYGAGSLQNPMQEVKDLQNFILLYAHYSGKLEIAAPMLQKGVDGIHRNLTQTSLEKCVADIGGPLTPRVMNQYLDSWCGDVTTSPESVELVPETDVLVLDSLIVGIDPHREVQFVLKGNVLRGHVVMGTYVNFPDFRIESESTFRTINESGDSITTWRYSEYSDPFVFPIETREIQTSDLIGDSYSGTSQTPQPIHDGVQDRVPALMHDFDQDDEILASKESIGISFDVPTPSTSSNDTASTGGSDLTGNLVLTPNYDSLVNVRKRETLDGNVTKGEYGWETKMAALERLDSRVADSIKSLEDNGHLMLRLDAFGKVSQSSIESISSKRMALERERDSLDAIRLHNAEVRSEDNNAFKAVKPAARFTADLGLRGLYYPWARGLSGVNGLAIDRVQIQYDRRFAGKLWGFTTHAQFSSTRGGIPIQFGQSTLVVGVGPTLSTPRSRISFEGLGGKVLSTSSVRQQIHEISWMNAHSIEDEQLNVVTPVDSLKNEFFGGARMSFDQTLVVMGKEGKLHADAMYLGGALPAAWSNIYATIAVVSRKVVVMVGPFAGFHHSDRSSPGVYVGGRADICFKGFGLYVTFGFDAMRLATNFQGQCGHGFVQVGLSYTFKKFRSNS